jgi:hypothetical protein
MVEVNGRRVALGAITIVLMSLSIWVGLISMGLVYQYQWRLKFAQSHLDLAQAASDATTQYQEISRAIEILQTFPKEGNYAYFNKLDPKTNLANAWKALQEAEAYAQQTTTFEKNSSAYNIAIYNIQEKIQYFEDEYIGAFNAYIEWGAGSYIGTYIGGVGLGIPWLICWIITFLWALTENGWEALAWILTSMPIWIAIAFFFWAGIVPVSYSGPV